MRISHAQHAQRILGHQVIGSQDVHSLVFIQCCHVIIHSLVMLAQVQHHIRRAFNRDGIPIFMGIIIERREIFRSGVFDFMDSDHALALRVEGHFLHTGVGLVQLFQVARRLWQPPRSKRPRWDRPPCDKSVLSVSVPLHFQPGVVIQRRHPQVGQHSRIVFEIDRFAVLLEFANRRIAAAGDRNELPVHPHPRDSHFILGQGAGLIRADHRGGAQGFDRGQPADQGMALDHLPHTQRQADGHHCRQALRAQRQSPG